jgi:excisionase family DNA binding protein
MSVKKTKRVRSTLTARERRILRMMRDPAADGQLTRAKKKRARKAEPDTLWTIKETSAFIRMSASWLYKVVEAGTFPHVKLGSQVRFVPDQVRKFAASSAAQSIKPQGKR